MQSTELWVSREDLRNTRVEQRTLAAPGDGEISVAIDRFALTANNVSYALTGDMIGYWHFYPADEGWGKVPVWGCGDVVASNCNGIEVGERIYGFFPMATHVTLQPGKVEPEQFMDFAAHRRDLPSLYNAYRRTQAEPAEVQAFETQRCLLFPLFATSYLLYDYLKYHEYFGASQILIGSASSKTGFGLARLLHDDQSCGVEVIGLTSPANAAFVESMACCSQIVTYDSLDGLDSARPSVYVDMSGDGPLRADLHERLSGSLKASVMVGATHWDSGGLPDPDAAPLPGPQPEMFFAPAHVDTREQDWGPGVVMQRAMQASMQLAQQTEKNMHMEWHRGADQVADTWRAMLDNKISGSIGLMCSLWSD